MGKFTQYVRHNGEFVDAKDCSPNAVMARDLVAAQSLALALQAKIEMLMEQNRLLTKRLEFSDKRNP